MTKLMEIEGIAEASEKKLKDAGIASVEALLAKAATKAGRDAIEKATGISGKQILKWANHADLFRIRGIAGQFAELLEAAGVDTVPELAQRKPAALVAKMVEVNDAKNLVRRLPTESEVAGWVAQAKTLPKTMTY